MADSDAAPAADEASTPPPSDPGPPTPAAELVAGGRDRESSSADMARYSSSSSYSPVSTSGLLPMPGMASSTGAMYVTRLGALLRRRDVKIVVAFWLIGLINNILYVIILSAAQDLVGNVPKGVVLLADVTPSLATKLVAPYFIHRVPHWVRVLVFTGLSVGGMLMVALTPPSQSVAVRMVGVAVASLSSGGGELSFLGLSHYYGHLSLVGWGSGTGAAGLAGAGLYVVLTQGWGLSVRDSLLFSACLPSIMLFAFFVVLPHDSLRQQGGWEGYSPVESEEEEEEEEEEEADGCGGAEGEICTESENAAPGQGERQGPAREESGFRSLVTPGPPVMRANAEGRMGQAGGQAASLRVKLRRARKLFLPYMAPLLLVYVAEYSINQGVSPTLLYPVESSPFQQLREFYPFYGFLYQLGVFASRSSTAFFRIRQLYVPAMLQVGNLVLLTLEALLAFMPSVYLVFAIILWEGLLGGAVYVNCFAEILDRVPPKEREFSLGVTAVSDSAGICIAGLASIVLERSLCNYQVAHGRDLCRKVKV